MTQTKPGKRLDAKSLFIPGLFSVALLDFELQIKLPNFPAVPWMKSTNLKDLAPIRITPPSKTLVTITRLMYMPFITLNSHCKLEKLSPAPKNQYLC